MAAESISDRVLLAVSEIREGKATPLTRELIGLGQRLAQALDATLAVTMPGNSDSAAADLIAHGADRVYGIEQVDADYERENGVGDVEQIARELRPLAILVGHTVAGADLAPRLAARLQSAVATACVGIAAEKNKLLFTRPCYGGNVRETISFTTQPAVATVKPGVGIAEPDASRKGEVVRVYPPAARRRVRVVTRERDPAGAARLEDAKIIVAGGRGLEGAEGFRMLEGLAQVLDASVGASRVPCDLGWCPHSWQIGLTGKTVTPDLYFAVGISGAGHHLAGCGNAKTIVAINTDSEAAIFREARFGVVGDYRKIVPALTAAVARLKQS